MFFLENLEYIENIHARHKGNKRRERKEGKNSLRAHLPEIALVNVFLYLPFCLLVHKRTCISSLLNKTMVTMYVWSASLLLLCHLHFPMSQVSVVPGVSSLSSDQSYYILKLILGI